MTTTTDDVLERCARAICEADGLDWDAQGDPQTNASGGDDRDYYLSHVRACLSALLPLPESVVRNSWDVLAECVDTDDFPSRTDMENAFTAAIHSILGEDHG